MDKYSGVIRVQYKTRIVEVPYSIDLSPGYGGLPYLGVKDKNGGWHHFIRNNKDDWHANGAGPRWPEQFLILLYEAFEIEYGKCCAER